MFVLYLCGCVRVTRDGMIRFWKKMIEDEWTVDSFGVVWYVKEQKDLFVIDKLGFRFAVLWLISYWLLRTIRNCEKILLVQRECFLHKPMPTSVGDELLDRSKHHHQHQSTCRSTNSRCACKTKAIIITVSSSYNIILRRDAKYLSATASR